MAGKAKIPIKPQDLVQKIINCARRGAGFNINDYEYKTNEFSEYLTQLKQSSPTNKLLYGQYVLARKICSPGKKLYGNIKTKEGFEIFSWYLTVVSCNITLKELLEGINNEKMTDEKCMELIKETVGLQRYKILIAVLKYNGLEERKFNKITYIIIEAFLTAETTNEYKLILSKLEQDWDNKIELSRNIYDALKGTTLTEETLEKIKEAEKRHIQNEKEKNPESFIGIISKMSDTELTKFLKENNADVVLNRLLTLNKKSTIPSLSSLIQRVETIVNQLKEEAARQKKDYITWIYNTMLVNNIWDKRDFIEKYYAQYGYQSAKTMADDLYRLECSLDNETRTYYKNEFEKNRKKEYIRLRPLLKDIIDGKINDVIDYYMKIGIPAHSLKNLIRGFVSSEEQRTMSKFMRRYFKDQSGKPIFEEYRGTDSNNIYCDIEITPELEQITLLFLKTYNIPKNFFGPAVLKLENNSELKRIFEHHYLLQAQKNKSQPSTGSKGSK